LTTPSALAAYMALGRKTVTRLEELAKAGILAKEHPLYEVERARRGLSAATSVSSVGVFLCAFATVLAVYVPVAAVVYVFFTPAHRDANWALLAAFFCSLAIPVYGQARWLRRLNLAFERLQDLERAVPEDSEVRRMLLESHRGYWGPTLLRAGREPTNDLLRPVGRDAVADEHLLRTGPPSGAG
jgi:hypothetical protein